MDGIEEEDAQGDQEEEKRMAVDSQPVEKF